MPRRSVSAVESKHGVDRHAEGGTDAQRRLERRDDPTVFYAIQVTLRESGTARDVMFPEVARIQDSAELVSHVPTSVVWADRQCQPGCRSKRMSTRRSDCHQLSTGYFLP
jgi:hypothetical protein